MCPNRLPIDGCGRVPLNKQQGGFDRGPHCSVMATPLDVVWAPDDGGRSVEECKKDEKMKQRQGQEEGAAERIQVWFYWDGCPKRTD